MSTEIDETSRNIHTYNYLFYSLLLCLLVWFASYIHVIRILRGPRNLFELHDYSNYRSSDYMSSTVYISKIIRHRLIFINNKTLLYKLNAFRL